MSPLAGTAVLVRSVVRRDRVRIGLWVLGIAAVVLAVASSVKGLYPDGAGLEEAASAISANAAQVVLNGPDRALGTLGGRIAFEVWNFGLVGVSLMSLLLVGRHTRGDEEAGRTELLRAAPVGRQAPIAASLAVTVATNLAVGALVASGLAVADLPVAGAVALGAAFAAAGLFFAALAALAAQVSANTRVVYGITGAALAAAFIVRGIGDGGDGTVSWLSPLGWAQASRPFAGERGWPLLALVAAAAALAGGAAVLAARRDLGAGMLGARPGRPTASRALSGPFGLALRLQRGTLVGWGLGLFAGGLALGSVGGDVEGLLGDSDTARDVFAPGGGDVTLAFLATFLLLLALLAAAFTVQSALRPAGEEAAGGAEAVLATPVSRARWLGAHLAVTAGGATVLLLAGGLSTAASYAVVSGDSAQLARLGGGALSYLPAVWLLGAVAVALYGVVPKAALAAWGVFAACVVMGLLGRLLELPQWLLNVSPFEHVPRLPQADWTLAPLAVLVGASVAVAALGVGGLRRRDLR